MTTLTEQRTVSIFTGGETYIFNWTEDTLGELEISARKLSENRKVDFDWTDYRCIVTQAKLMAKFDI